MKDGRAFQVPAWDAQARHREVVVEDRLRVLLRLPRLAAEELAPAQVARVGDVHVGEMHGLVVHRRVHALAARQGLERVTGRGDEQGHAVARRGTGAGIAVVREVRSAAPCFSRTASTRRPGAGTAASCRKSGRRAASGRSGRDRSRAAAGRRSRGRPSRRDRRERGHSPETRPATGRQRPWTKKGRRHACRRPCQLLHFQPAGVFLLRERPSWRRLFMASAFITSFFIASRNASLAIAWRNASLAKAWRNASLPMA